MNMTENEVFEHVSNLAGDYKCFDEKLTYEESLILCNLIEEIQRYQAIGTVEEFKRAKEMEAVYGQVKWERDIAISQLEEIGVGLGQKMDEFKALKEKSVAKKPIDKELYIECPSCGNIVTEDSYCQCGQYVK